MKRFIHLSSGAAGIKKLPNSQANTAVPFYFRRFCQDSLFSNLDMSTYARTKLEGENYVLRQFNKDCKHGMSVCVLRPPAIWGRGDPISTETILSWPKWMPHLLIGDPVNPMIFCRADNMAKFIQLADTGLRLNPQRIAGRSFEVGDCELSSLIESHWRILRDKSWVSSNDPVTSPFWRVCKLLGLSIGFKKDGRHVSVVVLPALVVFCIVMIAQMLDCLFSYKKHWHFLRVMTANNVAYCWKGILDVPALHTYQADCLDLFRTAMNDKSALTFSDWLQRFDMTYTTDAEVLQPQYLADQFKTMAEIAKRCLSLQGGQASLKLSEPLRLGPITVRNRVIKAATFESMCERDTCVPTDELIRYHTRQAAGGVGMTVVAYGCVSSDGRSFPTQICLRPTDHTIAVQTEIKLHLLCESVHKAGGLACMQLTHAGAFADATYNSQQPARGPSAIFNPLTLQFSKSLDGDQATLDRIEQDFVHSVDVCRRVGFDAIELHLGHGYLLSQFLSRKTNPKYASDPYKRLEYPLRILNSVIRRAHDSDERYVAVLVKFNVSELTEEDLPLSDTRIFAAAFVDAGADLLVPSGGHVMSNGRLDELFHPSSLKLINILS